MNGRELAALIDMGSDQTLVHPKYISPVLLRFTDKKAVHCVHGDEKLLPAAEVYVKVRGQTQWCSLRDTQVYAVYPLGKSKDFRIPT